MNLIPVSIYIYGFIRTFTIMWRACADYESGISRAYAAFVMGLLWPIVFMEMVFNDIQESETK